MDDIQRCSLSTRSHVASNELIPPISRAFGGILPNSLFKIEVITLKSAKAAVAKRCMDGLIASLELSISGWCTLFLAALKWSPNTFLELLTSAFPNKSL